MKAALCAVTIFAATVILGVLWVEMSVARELRELEAFWLRRAQTRGER